MTDTDTPKIYAVGYWRLTDKGLGIASWHCEAEQYVFGFMALQPAILQWAASLVTADGELWEGGFPL